MYHLAYVHVLYYMFYKLFRMTHPDNAASLQLCTCRLQIASSFLRRNLGRSFFHPPAIQERYVLALFCRMILLLPASAQIGNVLRKAIDFLA